MQYARVTTKLTESRIVSSGSTARVQSRESPEHSSAAHQLRQSVVKNLHNRVKSIRRGFAPVFRKKCQPVVDSRIAQYHRLSILSGSHLWFNYRGSAVGDRA